MPPVNPQFADDALRLEVAQSFEPDALEDDPELHGIVRFVAQLCNVPMAHVSLIEEQRQRFLAAEGLDERETPREISFCTHAMSMPALMEVRDATADPRFSDSPLVTGHPHVRFYAGQPLVSDEGAPLGALCAIDTQPRPDGLNEFQRQGMAVLAQAVMRRLNSRRAGLSARRAIEAREERLRRILEGVPQIAWSCDAAGNFDYVNRRWKELLGIEPPRVAEDWEPLVHPEDAAKAFAEWHAAFDHGKEFETEYRMRHADGGYRWVLSLAVPVAEEDGGVRWFGTVTDIDEVHRALDERDMLARELSHRIKNIFAVVIGLASLRARKAPEHAPFARQLTDVMRALGRAHDFVMPESGVTQESLQGLLGALFAPYALGEGEPRVIVRGADTAISARAATPLALVFHELATNSAKYGALSTDNGHVTLTIEDRGEQMALHWHEQGGPAVTLPRSEGFGSRLLELSVTGQLGGTFSRSFDETGLVAALTIAKSAITG